MQITDSRTTWRDYWSTRPRNVQLFTMALLAGLIAMYVVMGVFAICGLWRNNLFKLDTNWPWAAPLAALSLLGYRFKRPVLIHALAFLPIIVLQGMMAVSYGMTNRLDLIWFLPVGMISIAMINVAAFHFLVRTLGDEN